MSEDYCDQKQHKRIAKYSKITCVTLGWHCHPRVTNVTHGWQPLFGVLWVGNDGISISNTKFNQKSQNFKKSFCHPRVIGVTRRSEICHPAAIPGYLYVYFHANFNQSFQEKTSKIYTIKNSVIDNIYLWYCHLKQGSMLIKYL